MNIFGPPSPTTQSPVGNYQTSLMMDQPSPYPYTDQSDEATKYYDEMERIRRNVSPAVSAYSQMLQNYPQQADYEPNKIGKLVASLSGIAAGGHQPGTGAFIADKVMDMPYERALTEYNQKLKGTGEAATLERKDVEDQIKALTQARALGLKYDEFKLKTLENEQKNQYQQGQLGVAQGRAKDYSRSVDTGAAAQRETARNNAARLGIDQMRVQDAKSRTEIMMRDANTRDAAQRSLDSYHKTMGEAATKRAQTYADRVTQRPAAAYQQAKALQNALILMRADPRYKDFIDYDQQANVFIPRESDGSAKYDVFKKALKEMVESGIFEGTPFPNPDDQEEEPDLANQFIIKR